jgi:arylsulfatase A-like enzyme
MANIIRADNANKSKEDFFYRPEYLLAQVNDWLAKKPKRPFFTYIHFIPPHVPYDAPKDIKAIFLGKQPPVYWKSPSAMPAEKNAKPLAKQPSAMAGSVNETLNLYDANMRWADGAVGALEQALRKAGLFDNTLLIIMADHGEALGEHGYNWHPDCPYDEALHIPLILHFPGKGAPKGRVKALTQTIDLLPTLFDLHNKPWPAAAQGRTLLPLLAGATTRTHEYSFSAAGIESLCKTFIVRDLQSTLLLNEDGKTRALYDMVKDPHQSKNIIKSEPARAARLVEAFRRFAEAQPYPPLYFIDPKVKRKADRASAQPQTKDMPEKLRKQLETLGYLK